MPGFPDISFCKELYRESKPTFLETIIVTPPWRLPWSVVCDFGISCWSYSLPKKVNGKSQSLTIYFFLFPFLLRGSPYHCTLYIEQHINTYNNIQFTNGIQTYVSKVYINSE